MMDSFMGSVLPMGLNFAPRGWMACQGQILQIRAYTALFALLGNRFGGDGQTTFALPDLRGKVVIGQGQGPGLQNYTVGKQGGVEKVTLAMNQMTAHTHSLVMKAASLDNDTVVPTGHFLGGGSINNFNSAKNTTLSPKAATCPVVGATTPFSIMNPYLALSYNIAIEGIFPTKS